MATTIYKSFRHHILATTLFSTLVLSIGCSQSGQFPVTHLGDSNQSSGVADPAPETPDTEEPTTPTTPAEPEVPSYKMQALAWESTGYPQRTLWSQHLQKIIGTDWNTLLAGADDIEDFCPTYYKLDNDERANVWAQIFVAITKYESAYSPTSRMQETTMGTDPVTGKPVYSEGLLQLSYQDIQWAPWCEFDWSKDKYLSAADPKKTILDPYLNLDCGVGIMAKQVKNKGAIVLSSGVYWAVIKRGGSYQKISAIQSIVKSLALCK